MFTHDQIWAGIDRLAKNHGYSASGLARKAGLDPTSFNKSKRHSADGKPRWPSTESIAKILAVTGSTMDEFTTMVQAADSDETVPNDEEIAQRTAEILLETESVLFNAKTPFTVKSGRQQPVYVDCRRLISFVKERDIVMDYAAKRLQNSIGSAKIDVLAGGETAGIPYSAFIAERLKKPMIYVRKEPKGYGRLAQIEGALPQTEKPKVVLIEDLQTDGGSKEVFIDALRKADCTVNHAFVIFHYGILKKSEENLKRMKIKLHALATWWDVLKVAEQKHYFDGKTIAAVRDFLNNPLNWKA